MPCAIPHCTGSNSTGIAIGNSCFLYIEPAAPVGRARRRCHSFAVALWAASALYSMAGWGLHYPVRRRRL